ncbi:MAG: substrate-binding periplasmic protein [Candidatus Babeliales bacterium]
MQLKYVTPLVLAALSAALMMNYFKKEALDMHNTLIVGTNAEYQPYSFVKDGNITGFDIDLVRELAQRMGKKVVLKDMAFTTLLPELQMGSIHVIAAGMSPTAQRAQHVLFLAPHHSGDPLVLITPQGSGVTSLNNLKGKTVIVNEGFTADSFISTLDDIHIVRLPSVADAFLTLNSGRADAFVSAASSVQPFFALHGKEQWLVTNIPNTEDTAALAVSKKYPELHHDLQQQLNALFADGTISKLAKKWGLS